MEFSHLILSLSLSISYTHHTLYRTLQLAYATIRNAHFIYPIWWLLFIRILYIGTSKYLSVCPKPNCLFYLVRSVEQKLRVLSAVRCVVFRFSIQLCTNRYNYLPLSRIRQENEDGKWDYFSYQTFTQTAHVMNQTTMNATTASGHFIKYFMCRLDDYK